MKNTALLLATLALPATLMGCNKPDTPPTASSKATELCSVILNTGLTGLCIPGDQNQTVGIMIDSIDDEKARQLCIAVADKIKPMTATLSGQWRLEVYSPHRSDKPLNYCALH